jgi:hypothetical protein
MTEPKRGRGRPRTPPETHKRHSVGIRVTAAVKAKIEAAADAAGRSQAQEIEFRLECSYLLAERLDRLEQKIDALTAQGNR